MKKLILLCLVLLLLPGCAGDQSIVNNVDEREANEIVVFLASKGISALKIEAPTTGAGAGPQVLLFNIAVPENQSTQAMALLNRYGLPRKQGTNLLTLFPGGGLVSSDREETIRYQAGLAAELANIIRKMDGVIDANVQISFPPTEAVPTPGAPPQKITAAVYVKHQGVLDDPNSHMEIKIKRFMSGSVNGLNFEDVSVIGDRARLADITLQPEGEMIGPRAMQQTYVSIWGIVLTKGSLMRFRIVFFLLVVLCAALAAGMGWLLYKFYPLLRKGKEGSSTEIPPPGS